MNRTRLYAFAASGAVVMALVAGFWAVLGRGHDCSASAVAGGEAAIGGPFELVTHTGETVTDKDVITGPTLIYFGYTFCPDVCPLDTARMAEAVDLLAEQGHQVKPIFITIDPVRDTPEALSDYVTYTHDDLLGLTGSEYQVAQASKAYRTYYRKQGDGEHYLMDHSAFTYLVGPDGFWDFFRRDVAVDRVAEVTACHINARA